MFSLFLKNKQTIFPLPLPPFTPYTPYIHIYTYIRDWILKDVIFDLFLNQFFHVQILHHYFLYLMILLNFQLIYILYIY